MVVEYRYDAWGNHAALNPDGSDCESGIGILNPFRYRGYYYDTETELYFLQTLNFPEVGISELRVLFAKGSGSHMSMINTRNKCGRCMCHIVKSAAFISMSIA